VPISVLFEVRPGYSAADVLGAVPEAAPEAHSLERAFTVSGAHAIRALRKAARQAQTVRASALQAAGHTTAPALFRIGDRTLVVRRSSAHPFGANQATTGMFNGSFNPANVWRVAIEPADAAAVRSGLREQAGVAEVNAPGRLSAPGLCDVNPQGYLLGRSEFGMNAEAAQGRMTALGFGHGTKVPIGVADVGFPEIRARVFQRRGVAKDVEIPFEGDNGENEEQTHGLSTLCGLLGTHDRVRGVAPDASPRLRVINTNGTIADLAATIAQLALAVGPGGVVLVEFQLLRGMENIPVYLASQIRSVIRAAAFYGVLVVVPSANTKLDLTAEETTAASVSDEPMNVPMLLVGGVHPRKDVSGVCQERRVAKCGWGPRVDCYGWFDNVAVLPDDTTVEEPNEWGGTSAASAMIAGAAALLQSFCRQKYGVYLDAFELRALLRERDERYSTKARAWVADEGAVAETSDVIGVMPDLDAIMAALENGQLPAPDPMPPSGPEELGNFLLGLTPPNNGIVGPTPVVPKPATDAPHGARCFRAPRLRKPRLRWPCRC